MVVNGFRYGQCVRFGAVMFFMCNYILKGRTQAIWEGPLPYCHRVLRVPGANAMARMRRVQHELCLSRADSDNAYVGRSHRHGLHTPVKHGERVGLQPGQNITPPSAMHLDVRHRISWA
jgi:hypothetical protein